MSIAEVLTEGRLIRGMWSREENGRLLLCLYTAMVGDPDARPESCPAALCPAWLAHLLPWIDDAGTEAHWRAVVERVARLAPRFADLPPETEWRVRALCVREAMRHTDDADVLAACERVAVLCESGAPNAQELAARPWVSARDEAARAAMTAAVWAAAVAPEPAAAKEAARQAKEAARAAWAASHTAASSAWAADRLIDAILDEITRSLEAP